MLVVIEVIHGAEQQNSYELAINILCKVVEVAFCKQLQLDPQA